LNPTKTLSVAPRDAAAPSRVGVGFPYIDELSSALYQMGLLDFVEMTPETLCRERRPAAERVLELIPERLERARLSCAGLPIVVHGVELSIGSAHGLNSAYLDMLEQFQARWPFLWHSEHMSFQTVLDDDGKTVDVGVPLPLPPTVETVRTVGTRARKIKEQFGVVFLLENVAHYLSPLPADPQIGDEIEMLNQVCAAGECGLLLDLHNLYCNAVNQGFNAFHAVDRISLERVHEVHVAGGRSTMGFWTDSHDGRVPDAVWELVEYTLPRCWNVRGLVFEVLDAVAANLGVDVIASELRTARSVWTACTKPT